MTDDSARPARLMIVTGSARGDGNTASNVRSLVDRLGGSVAVADLSTLTIGPFDYMRTDCRDDFGQVVDAMLASDHIVFATPVYWYSMSGPMKTFFDRLTDLLSAPDNRIAGRALAGRNVWLLATGTDPALPPGFEEPFARTAGYFGMIWRRSCYIRVPKDVPFDAANFPELDDFARSILG